MADIKPQKEIDCHFTAATVDRKKLLQSNAEILKFLMRIKNFTLEDKLTHIKNAATGIVDNIKFCLPLGDLIDIDKEKKRIFHPSGFSLFRQLLGEPF